MVSEMVSTARRWGPALSARTPDLATRGSYLNDLAEDNGAPSNPQARVELARLADLCSRLRGEAALNPRSSRSAPAKVNPVLETVTRVLEVADRPMRAREIHQAAEYRLGQPLRWTSVRVACSPPELTG